MSYVFEKKYALEELKKHSIKKPLASIIVINNTKSLNDIKLSLSSINNQSFDNIEVVIIEMNKNKEIEKYIINDKRIRIVEEKINYLKDLKKIIGENSKYCTIIEAGEYLDRSYIETCLLSLELSNEYTATFTDSVNVKDKKIFNNIFDNETLKIVPFPVPNLFFKTEIIDYLLYEKVLKIRTWNSFFKIMKKFKITHQSYYGFLTNKKGSILTEEEYDLFTKIQIESPIVNYPYENYYFGKIKPEFNKKEFEQKKNTKTNILMFIPYMLIGGAEKFDLDFIRLVDKEKYNVTILTDHPNEYILRQEFEKYADTIFEMTSFLERKHWLSFVEYIIYTRNIDLIFVTNSLFGYSIIPYIKTTFPSIPIFDYIHNIELYNRDGGYGRDSGIMTPFIDRTLFCCKKSEEEGTKFFNIPKEKTSTVYIGVDKDKFCIDNNLIKQMRKEYDLEETINIGYICRIDYQKRPFLLVEIMKQAVKENDNIRFIIGGDGPLLEEMKQKVIDNGIEEKVIFLGVVTNTKEFYSICDMTINCSIKEGLALTAYESLAMGIPVISADVGGHKELINEKVGIIVPLLQKEIDIKDFNYSEAEINSYVKAINKIIKKLDYYKNNCRKSITEEFDLKFLGKRMEKEIEFIINKNTENSISDIYKLNNYKELLLEYICYYLMASQYEHQTCINKYLSNIRSNINQIYNCNIKQETNEKEKKVCKEYILLKDFGKSIVKVLVFPFRIILIEVRKIKELFGG